LAIGTQFLTLRTNLRAELRRSTTVNVGVSDVGSLDRTLNHVYRTLYLQKDWAHLRKVFTLQLATGQRHYDFPTGLNPDRVESVAVYWAGTPVDLPRGIGFEQMNEFDSDEDERFEPAMRWDVRWTGSATQIEIWPIPSTGNQKVRFKGIQAIEPLVNDEDTCMLDDELVVLWAAAELATAADLKDAAHKRELAQAHLAMLSRRMRGGEREYRLGVEGHDVRPFPRVTVQIRS
jgi:hypothetical protein